uniref:Uncharacterized protein n=1 Tax=Arundo donax TaxID=35708 RepID=A0A0A9CV54_ARUDO
MLFPKRIDKPFGQKIGLKRFSFFVCEACTSAIPIGIVDINLLMGTVEITS